VKLGGPLKEKCLCITVPLDTFKSKVFTHYNCSWGPLWKQSTLFIINYSCCWATLKARHFTHYSCKGVPRQVPRLPSLKHITAYNHDNDLIWEYETAWTRSVHPMRVLSHLMCACKHCNVKYLYIIEHIEVADEFIISKNTDFTRFFIIKPRHTSRLKSWSGWKKPSVGALVACGKKPTTVTWSDHLKIYCRVIVTQ